MANITTKLTTNQFIKLYGDSQYVRDFSEEGVEAVLARFEEYQNDISSEIMDMVQEFESIPAELLERIENEDELASDDLLKELRGQLEVLDGWEQGVADLLAEYNGIDKLVNGKYMVLGNEG